MTKDFCDRCGELIPPGRYATGSHTNIPGPPGKESVVFSVEIKIQHAELNWKLCLYCCDEVIDESYRQIVGSRERAKESRKEAGKS